MTLLTLFCVPSCIDFEGWEKKMPDYVRGIFNYFIVIYLIQIFMDKAKYTIYVKSIKPS